MVKALSVHARTVPTSLFQNMVWWRSFFTITRLNEARVSTAAGATGNWPPTDSCCVGHGVAHFHLLHTITFIGSAVRTFPRCSQPGIPISYTGIIFGPLRRLIFHLPHLLCFFQHVEPCVGVHGSKHILPLTLHSLFLCLVLYTINLS